MTTGDTPSPDAPTEPSKESHSKEALELWRDLCEKDDRTSPEEYPDMALITQDEFCLTLDRFRAAGVREWRLIGGSENDPPRQRVVLLWAVTSTDPLNWKMATGYCFREDEALQWNWEGRNLKSYDVKPTHWMPLPEPPHD